MNQDGDVSGVVTDHRSGARGTVADWVAAFEHVWEAPQRRLDRLMALLGPQVVLRAPTYPSRTVGQEQGRMAFQQTLRAFPDLSATILSWGSRGEHLFIEMVFTATIARRQVRWHSVDHIRFRDAVAAERTAYFNPGRVRKALLSNPVGWWQLLRLRGHA